MQISWAHAHPYEMWSLALSALALCVSVWLFALKLGDLVRVKIEGTNGPILFMAVDKIRHQGLILALCMGMVMVAIAGVNNPGLPTPQTLNMVMGSAIASLGIVVDGVFTVYRRRRLAELVEAYKAAIRPKPGGLRETGRKDLTP